MKLVRFVLALAVIILIVGGALYLLMPRANPVISGSLPRGLAFTVTDVGAGPSLAYGGSGWPRNFARSFHAKVPFSVRNQSTLVPATFSNGVSLTLAHVATSNDVWNGKSALYSVDASGAQHRAALHGVNFVTTTTSTNAGPVEEMYFEAPATDEAEMRLRLYQTNYQVDNCEFRISNPLK